MLSANTQVKPRHDEGRDARYQVNYVRGAVAPCSSLRGRSQSSALPANGRRAARRHDRRLSAVVTTNRFVRAIPGRSRVRALAGRMYGYPNVRLYATGRFAVEQLTLPKFLGIGAPKAGTTWLHHNLAAHPDLYLPPEKELHYFTVALHRGMRWYSSRFEDAGARIPGEITPGYIALNQRRIALVRDLMPDCRLILIMRNPVDRAWSHAVMKLARREGRTVESVSDAEFAAHFRGTMSRRRSDYLGTIKRWHAVFPPRTADGGVV